MPTTGGTDRLSAGCTARPCTSVPNVCAIPAMDVKGVQGSVTRDSSILVEMAISGV